jgi:hypothetical protein
MGVISHHFQKQKTLGNLLHKKKKVLRKNLAAFKRVGQRVTKVVNKIHNMEKERDLLQYHNSTTK